MEKSHFSSTEGISIALVIYLVFPLAFADADLTHFVTHPAVRIKSEFTILKVEAPAAMECAAHCLVDENCTSVSFNSNNRTCDLSEYIVNTSSIQGWTIPDPTWIVMYRPINRPINVRTAVTGCLADWVELGEKCYMFNGTQMNYTKADEYCKEMEGKIIEPKTSTMNQLLKTYMNETFGNKGFKFTWLGMTEVKDDGSDDVITYVWSSDNSTITFNDWFEGQPDGTSRNKCARIDRQNERKWHYYGCSHGASVVCEK